MGLDDFKSDNGNEDNDGEASSTEEEESKEGIDLTEEDMKTGLASFKTNETDDEIEEKDRERSNPWMEDFTSGQWNDMSTKEKVRYVRENYYPDYRPEVKLEVPWEYRRVIEIRCKCRNTFTFRSAGTCIECGRAYTFENGMVKLKHDPHTDNKEEQ